MLLRLGWEAGRTRTTPEMGSERSRNQVSMLLGGRVRWGGVGKGREQGKLGAEEWGRARQSQKDRHPAGRLHTMG